MESSLTNGQFERHLLKTLTKDANLSNDTKQNLEKLQAKNNPYQAELLERWARVTFPRFTCETILQLNILHQRHIKETNKNREQQRLWLIANGQQQEANQIQDLQDDSITSRSACILVDANKTSGWNPGTRSFVVIENNQKISLENHQSDIEQCLFSKSINIPKSLFNVLNKGVDFGYSSTQFGQLFLLFIKEHLAAHYSSAMSFAMSTDSLFQYLVSLIDTSSEIRKVRKCLQEINRHPGQALTDPVLKVKSLTATLLWMLKPNESLETVQKKSDKAAIKSIFQLVDSKARTLLSQWKRRQNDMEAETSLNELIEAANNIELLKTYELTDTKKLNPDFDEIDISLNSFFMKSGMQRPRSGSNRSRRSSSEKSNFSRNSSSERSERSPTPKSYEDFSRQKRDGKEHSSRRKDKHKTGYPKHEVKKVGKGSSSFSCAKCGSNTHKSINCKRYPFYYETHCRHCKERKVLLYHPDSLCRFQKSRYRTPRPSKSPESFRNKSQSPSFLDNLEKFKTQKN